MNISEKLKQMWHKSGESSHILYIHWLEQELAGCYGLESDSEEVEELLPDYNMPTGAFERIFND